jgi:hypothetical protein
MTWYVHPHPNPSKYGFEAQVTLLSEHAEGPLADRLFVSTDLLIGHQTPWKPQASLPISFLPDPPSNADRYRVSQLLTTTWIDFLSKTLDQWDADRKDDPASFTVGGPRPLIWPYPAICEQLKSNPLFLLGHSDDQAITQDTPVVISTTLNEDIKRRAGYLAATYGLSNLTAVVQCWVQLTSKVALVGPDKASHYPLLEVDRLTYAPLLLIDRQRCDSTLSKILAYVLKQKQQSILGTKWLRTLPKSSLPFRYTQRKKRSIDLLDDDSSPDLSGRQKLRMTPIVSTRYIEPIFPSRCPSLQVGTDWPH